MSKVTFIDDNSLKNEIKALNNYVNRDENSYSYQNQYYNLNVVEVMLNEIQDIVKGLKPCENIDSPATCPYCGSNNVQFMYKKINLDGSGQVSHYICNDCQKEFEVF